MTKTKIYSMIRITLLIQNFTQHISYIAEVIKDVIDWRSKYANHITSVESFGFLITDILQPFSGDDIIFSD